MFPVLLRLGPLTLHTYGFFVAAGFLAALSWCSYLAARRGIAAEVFQDLFFYVVFSALLGARLFYVLLNLTYFAQAPLKIFYIWQGGLVFYGGFIVAVPVLVWRLRRTGLPVLSLLDIAVQGLVLAQAIGRLGCLSAGCCYGKPCQLPWAISFRHELSHAPLGVDLHPTQLYHAIANLLIFVFLYLFYRSRPASGWVTVLYLVLYAAGRFTIEFWRGDPRGAFGYFSTSQWISFLLLGLAGIISFYLYRRSRNTEA